MIKILYICLALSTMKDSGNFENICYNQSNLKKIEEYTNQYKIPKSIYFSLLWKETRYNSNLKSKAGACGISQVLPQYTDLYKENKSKKVVCNELKKTKVGIKYGAKAFSYWLHKYAKGKVDIALCAYNAGFVCKEEKGKNYKSFKRGMKYYSKPVLKFNKRLNRKITKIKSYVKEINKKINTLLKQIVHL